MPLRAEIFDPRTEPVPDDWEKFLRSEDISSAWDDRALAAIAWCSQRTVYIGIVWDGEQPAALFVGDFGSPFRRLPEYSSPDAAPGAGFFFCRVLAGFDEGFAFAAALDTPRRKQVRRAFEKALRRRLGLRCLGVVYQNVSRSSLEFIDTRLRLRRPVSPNIVLRNRWASLDDYLGELPRGRRRKFQRILETTDRATDLRVVSAVEEIPAAEASHLEALTRAKHTGPGQVMVPLPRQYFERLNGRPGVGYFAHVDSGTGELRNFDLTFQVRGHLVTTVTGSSDAANASGRGLYHDLYLREIRYLIDNNLTAVEFGKGMLDLKRRFGAEPVAQFVVAGRV